MTTSSYIAPGPLHAFTLSERSLLLDSGGLLISISVLTPSIVRVRLSGPDGNFAPRRSWSVTPADEDFPAAPFEFQENQQSLSLTTDMLTVRIERDSCRISFADVAGNSFCADAQGMEIGTPETSLLFAHSGLGGDPASRVACSKRIEPGEHFFGFGERTGLLNKRGRELTNWTTDPAIDAGHGINTDPLYIAMPVCLSVRPGLAYGVLLNNTWRSRFSMGWDDPDTWLMEAAGGELDYYVILGPTPAEVTAGLSSLLGTMPLPPRWALGYHQSRWGYDNEAIVRDIAANFRSRDIPCDVIHLDIDYMDGYRVFTWNPERFPAPQKLLADLREDGFRVVTIIDPGVKVDPDYAVYREGLERECFIRRDNGELFQGYVWPGAALFPDFMRRDVQQWWGNWIKTLVNQGVSGIWNDMNEPTSFDRPFTEGIGVVGTLPLDAVQGQADERTTHAETHNCYGQGMARATYEGLRKQRPDERPFVLTRSGFAGIQCWSACWMGDNSSMWEHLEMSMPQMMNMGLSGVPFVGTDIGGFFGHCSAELLARWIQFGIFSPFCRGHSCTGTAPQEPWVFGPQVETIYREYVQLRYRLLPYLYSLFWEATQQGTPVLRPLFYHFPDDPATYQLHDQVLFGPAFMAAPVYQPGRTHRAVYLPQGQWFDWWTDERISGPAHILADAPLERMPLYVRAGAIIPGGPAMAYTDEKPLEPLTLDLFPGSGAFTLYEDDGRTFAYEQGEFCTTHISMHLEESVTNNQVLTLTIGARTGAYRPPQRRLVLRLHDIDERTSMRYPEAAYDSERRLLIFQFDDDGTERVMHFHRD